MDTIISYVLALYSLGVFLYCFLKAAENLLVLAYPTSFAISAMDKLLPDSKTSECSDLHCCIYFPSGIPYTFLNNPRSFVWLIADILHNSSILGGRIGV